VDPRSTTITGGESLQIKVSGGKQPVTITLLSGSGSITSGGLFMAPLRDETDIIQVVDDLGSTAIVSITVKAPIPPLSLGYSPALTYNTELINLNAAGGVPPYRYTLLAGAGTLRGNTFTPGPAVNTTLFRVIDSKGDSVQISIAVGETPVMIFYGEDNPYVLNDPEREGNGEAFRTFTSAAADRVAIVKCEKGNNLYMATAEFCEGKFTAGAAVGGYISKVQKPNTQALYYSPNNRRFSYGRSEKDSALVGYVPVR
jgi:hypothetical protein